MTTGRRNSRRGNRPGNGAANPVDEKKIVFAELVIPKTTAYVGEPIPAEIRLGISTRVPHRLIEGATLSGQGFTAQRMPNPAQTMESINGRSYEIVTFKTAITPVKSGKLEIAAKDAKAIIQVPRRNNGTRPRSPFDIFGMDDPFSDPFSQRSFCRHRRTAGGEILERHDNARDQAAATNAPASFSGAVGNFLPDG